MSNPAMRVGSAGDVHEMRSIAEIGGNLTVTDSNADSWSTIEKVSGDLIVEAEGFHVVPALTQVDGSLLVRAAGFRGSALACIGGSLLVDAEGVELPALTNVGGGLFVGTDGFRAPRLSHVGGVLFIRRGCHAPSLISVSGQVLPPSEVALARLKQVAEAVLASPDALRQGEFDGIHYIADWAVRIAGEEGAELNRRLGPIKAANVLLGREGSLLFCLANDSARAALEAFRE